MCLKRTVRKIYWIFFTGYHTNSNETHYVTLALRLCLTGTFSVSETGYLCSYSSCPST